MAPKYNPMLAIVIVSYKSEPLTIDFVKRELSKVTLPHKIIIVNNAATDESNNIYKEGLDAVLVDAGQKRVDNVEKLVYVISNPENSGFAIGNNIGAKFARDNFNPEYFLFTNNDIKLVQDDVVGKLIAKLSEHPEVGIIGPMVRGLNGDYQSPEPYISFADKCIWMYLSTPFLSKEKKAKRFHLDYAKMGSFFIVPSQAYIECGMMDEHTFLFAEEMILSERMAAIGKKVYYDPEVSVIHAHGATIKKSMPSRKMANIQFKSNAYYYHHYRKVSNLEIAIGRLVLNMMRIVKS